MKAIVQDAYGSPEVLRLTDIDTPAVGDGNVLVRVHAAAVHPGDAFILAGVPYVMRPVFGLRRPRVGVRGYDLAGRVETVGRNVQRFQPGDEVFGWTTTGSLAEYVCVPQDNLAPKPANVTMEQAGAVTVSAMPALHALRDAAKVQPGHRVLIVGASGGVGTFAVQIAKALGAAVTGVCSTTNTALVASLGADAVIDYTLEDFTQRPERYDVIIDLVGNRSLADMRRVLGPSGTLVLVGGTGGRWLKGTHRFAGALLVTPFVRQRLRPLIHRDRKTDLKTLRQLIEAGKVTPVVSAHYPLAEVPDAIRHFAQGHARGKVVITI